MCLEYLLLMKKNLHIFFTVDLHLVLRRASSLIMDKTTWSLSCKF